MTRRAPSEVKADTPEEALWRKLDFFPSPPWAARAGAELVLSLDPEAKSVWEPACGAGHMAAPLADFFETVHASDVYPHGYGDVVDFLGDDDGPEVDWIFTNPPFKVAEQFARIGLRRARRGVALLLRIQFIESVKRYSLLYGETPLTVLAPFVDRVPMMLGKWDPQQSTASAYAFFVWVKGHPGPPIVRAFPPGTRRRHSHRDDAPRFGWSDAAPLLDQMGEAA